MTAWPPNLLVHCVAWQRRSLVVGLVAVAALTVGGLFDPPQFFRAYLASYLFFFGIALGSMALLMIYNLTGGAWGFLIRRFLEAALGTLPLVAVAFLPIAAGASYLYPWAQPALVESNELVQFQQIYMHPPLVWARALLFFLLWVVLAFLLGAASRAQDRAATARQPRWSEYLNGFGLVIYGVSIHFASIDWLMSLQPAFHSTIFGPLVVSSQLLSAHALALGGLVLCSGHEPLAERISLKALTDLGNLLLSFVVVWTYMCWFQFMLIWIANMPVDVVWYAPRLQNGWQWMALGLVVFGFAVPFLLLLWRRVKQKPRAVAWICGLVLATQAAFSIYQVSPPFQRYGFGEHWMEPLALVALGGVWVALFLRKLQGRPILPLRDPNEASAVHLRESDEHEAQWEESLSHG
ncbi:MAG TPA: hypothetical protein VHV08_13000 [Pirellulales bacterium]|nr:hypothetical protein [Pirellulales bacterium]